MHASAAVRHVARSLDGERGVADDAIVYGSSQAADVEPPRRGSERRATVEERLLTGTQRVREVPEERSRAHSLAAAGSAAVAAAGAASFAATYSRALASVAGFQLAHGLSFRRP